MKAGITCITSGEARGVKAKPSYTYKRVLEGYKEWLDIIGYSKDTINSLPAQLKPFFLHLKNENITSLQEVPKQTIRNYYQSLKQKKSNHTGELLKNSTLNGHLRNLRLFSDYLEETGQGNLLIDIQYEPKEYPEREVLTLHEVDQLYSACSEQVNGLRERAILSLYYGCGLRCKEGINLNVNDILLDKQLVHIRKAKNQKARYVPFVEGQKKDFEHYLKYYRPHLINGDNVPFLLNNQGRRLTSTSLSKTLKTLIERTGNEELQERKIGLHTLRHSIATHLLQCGMEIDAISQFLGHSGIRSTQTYLHLVHL
ncbi:tyrosine recombinase XerD [Fulvivirga imtechensis AK7]|uniref:Tyrosine recombinase XerD n=1 Tax=Fulvivirga imtechensis AK7 TaxID=1237149 RepID=L8JII3_9BACT|nr:tyrosine-type recombinase/integrase [Fulvivirga imtechensis]ELR68691.1 tyrosine recombinase XerD [Fulvivirga imtechensis AK7]